VDIAAIRLVDDLVAYHRTEAYVPDEQLAQRIETITNSADLDLAAHGEGGHHGHDEGATGYPHAVDVAVDSGGTPMAPADSLARLRKSLLDRAERREAPVTQLCREAGISRSRFWPCPLEWWEMSEPS
jgi:hypothetical protein